MNCIPVNFVICAAAAICIGFVNRAPADVVYSETFDAATVPTNWIAQNGTAGMATLAIVDDTGGINTGNALSITAATRQGTIGSFSTVSFVDIGDVIELAFDARLLTFPNNSGGFRIGLYNDNGGAALSSGYRVSLGTGANVPSADIQADGGDPDIAFGTNRENPVNFANDLGGIADNDPHSFLLRLTRTFDGTDNGVQIDILQNGESLVEVPPVIHITGQGAGTAIPIQTSFNQVVFTTNGGITGMVDNIEVSYIPAATAQPGDFDGDGDVDGADFVAWQTNFPKAMDATLAEGDADGDGDVDGADFVVWQTNFPFTPGAGASPVPEPSGVLLGLMGCAVAVAGWRRLKPLLSPLPLRERGRG